jgi:hypothetical protein
MDAASGTIADRGRWYFARRAGWPFSRAGFMTKSLASNDRTTRHHPWYAISQNIRKHIEEPFGWAKTVADLRKTRDSRSAQGRLANISRHDRLQPRQIA